MGKFEEAAARTRRGVTERYSDSDVKVKRSRFLASKGVKGRGLYSNRRLEKGYVIGEFVGRLLTDKEAEAKKGKKGYMFDVRQRGRIVHVIDGADSRTSSVPRFANAADTERQQNARWRQHKCRFYMELIKTVARDTEILTWYGKNTDDVVAA
jgi:hypothetical protein